MALKVPGRLAHGDGQLSTSRGMSEGEREALSAALDAASTAISAVILRPFPARVDVALLQR
ncbi:hypothetical protein GCM10009764_89040 [Nocardia ninae]|uniref:Uncharacterized protein n=1 Tax=Nocardia ninae NBRC 108245 TaxID=1210091 RepID=A0A511MUS8_9NOCA|nr:hypothetical protein NN4_88820 [Nocardia ninae NBRC 108245]